MSLEQRAAELVAVPVRDFDLAGATAVVRAGVGGVLLLGSALPPADLAAQLRRLRAQAGDTGGPLVLVDQEGGGVQRLRGAVTSLPWPQEMAAQMSPAQVRTAAARLGRQMRALGVTVDLAPVLDVDDRPGPSATNADGKRSFSGDAQTVARYGVAFDAGLRAGGVLGVVKHFPGLGGAVGNSDKAPVATLPLSQLRTQGLVPFRAAIEAGARAVMVSNASVPGLTTRPASLSPAVVTGLLRHELGFRGLVVTDSLSAVSVRAASHDLADATVRAVAAGSDLVLFGATDTAADRAALEPAAVRATYHRLVAALVAAARSGTIPAARLDTAAAHVLAAKGVDRCGD
jgi:beta-N-acetylhexosaminidase